MNDELSDIVCLLLGMPLLDKCEAGQNWSQGRGRETDLKEMTKLLHRQSCQLLPCCFNSGLQFAWTLSPTWDLSPFSAASTSVPNLEMSPILDAFNWYLPAVSHRVAMHCYCSRERGKTMQGSFWFPKSSPLVKSWKWWPALIKLIKHTYL